MTFNDIFKSSFIGNVTSVSILEVYYLIAASLIVLIIGITAAIKTKH